MDYINEITALEWDFFQQTENEGGRAGCQDNRPVFQVNRASQFRVWPEDALASYLADLKDYAAQGRNPVEEKYARMMEYTAPEAYAKLKEFLPELAAEARAIVDEVCRIHVDWQLELAEHYPALTGQGRATTQRAGSQAASMQVYWQSELATYSLQTLQRYRRHVLDQKAAGVNLNAAILEHTVHAYGYAGLDEAEAAYRR